MSYIIEVGECHTPDSIVVCVCFKVNVVQHYIYTTANYLYIYTHYLLTLGRWGWGSVMHRIL